MKQVTAVMLVLALVFGLCGCAQDGETSLSEEEILGVCELATLECYYNNVAKVEKEADNIFQKDREMWIEYEGKVTIGIDMAGVEIRINGNNVKIKLPEVKILSSNYEFGEDAYISSEDGWLIKNKISAEEQQAAVIEAQNAMEESIKENKTAFIRAELQAKELIENYIIRIGEITGEEYTIEWEK